MMHFPAQLFAFFAFAGPAWAASRVTCRNTSVSQQLQADLSPLLSQQDLISTVSPARWSEFDEPSPAAVVNVATESDVAVTVKYLTDNSLPFLAQNGGGGWATTFDLGSNGVLINLASLNQVTFNADKTEATIGGGVSINDTIQHAYAAGALVETGNCNCVGTLGAILGGGYGNLVGLYGLGVDSVLSMNVVTADGQLQNVTAESDPELFWGLLGAGPNFGIVTSAVVKAYPATEDDMSAWTGDLVFTSDKLEQVVQAIQNLTLESDMNIFLYFIAIDSVPSILVTPFLYKGNATSGRLAFASILDIGPEEDTTTVIPYNEWNSGADAFCTRGGRKPSYGVGFQNMVPTTWRQVWDKYTVFQAKTGAENSIVLLEAYSLIKARSIDYNSTSFPHRDVNFNAVAIPWYNDTALDADAEEFGSAARDLWRASDDLTENATYVNFAYGDEALEVVYGDSLSRLQALKQRVDPNNTFNQWFDIQ